VIAWRVFLPERHEHARHSAGEVKTPCGTSSPSAEVLAHVGRPTDFAFRQQQQSGFLYAAVEAPGAPSGRSTACVSGRFLVVWCPSRTHRYGTASSRSASTPENPARNFITSITRASTTRRVVVIQIGLDARKKRCQLILLPRPGRNAPVSISRCR